MSQTLKISCQKMLSYYTNFHTPDQNIYHAIVCPRFFSAGVDDVCTIHNYQEITVTIL